MPFPSADLGLWALKRWVQVFWAARTSFLKSPSGDISREQARQRRACTETRNVLTTITHPIYWIGTINKNNNSNKTTATTTTTTTTTITTITTTTTQISLSYKNYSKHKVWKAAERSNQFSVLKSKVPTAGRDDRMGNTLRCCCITAYSCFSLLCTMQHVER